MLGAKCVNALSSSLYVSSSRDGKKETITFKDGVKDRHEITDISDKTQTGVTVTFYPDIKYLETITFSPQRLETMLREFSFLCKDLEFTFVNENESKTQTYCSKRGLYDYLEYLNKDKQMICKPFYFDFNEGTFGVEVAFGYNNSYVTNYKLYTNNIPQDKGTHLTGFKTAFTSVFNTFAREKKWLKDKDENFSGSDLEEGQLLIINFKMIDPVFKGQNKEELSSSEGRTFTQKAASEYLKKLFTEREKEVRLIFDKAKGAKKARDAAKKARDAVRDALPKDKKKKNLLSLPSKLVDCWTKNRLEAELFISEGDSAASGLVEGRDAEYVAVFPVRGKVVSAFKNSTEKIFANQEVVNLIKAIGLELDAKSGKLIYDIKKLRYGRIFLAADADSDGASIRNLLIELFWWLCPELVINGHIYTTMPPLFRITTKKNEYIFLKDEAELEEYKAKHIGEKYLVSRNKGLGEQNAEELAYSLLDKTTRNVAKLVVENKKETDVLIDILMGSSVPPRRAYLLAHEEEANEDN